MSSPSTPPPPFCTENGTLADLHIPPAFANQRIVIASIYLTIFVPALCSQLLCFASISHRKHLQFSCYKLMLIVSFLDIWNLINSLFMCGIFSLFSVTHCQHEQIVFAIIRQQMIVWYAYCSASMILALDRLLQFANPAVGKCLFGNQRAWLWIIPICVHSLTLEFTTPNPVYIFVPNEGMYVLKTSNDPPINVNHVCNNAFKFIFVSVSYFAVWILIKVKRKDLTNHRTNMERTLSIQALLIGIFAGFSTIGFNSLEYLPLHNVSLIGFTGVMLWASVHCASAWIYLLMNRSIRSTALQIVKLRRKPRVSYVSSKF